MWDAQFGARDLGRRRHETQRRCDMDALLAMRRGIFAWLDQISEEETLPDDIVGVLVGLFESPKGYTLYVTGSKTFDEDDSDWACNWDFEPRSKYLTCVDETVNAMKWHEFLAEAIRIVKEYVAEKPESLLAQAEHLGIGFDEGDLEVLK
jgi:hypothetical protein